MSDKEELFREEEEEVGVKEISLGIILPPRAVTRIMADLVPLGPVTLTRPVGKVFIVVLPEIFTIKCLHIQLVIDAVVNVVVFVA